MERAPSTDEPEAEASETARVQGPIGYSKIPILSAEAREHNEKALIAHRRGDYMNAAAGFAEALEIQSERGGFPGARYNLACALARLGKSDEAVTHLGALLERDLPRFGRRLDSDADLEGLRASAQWETVVSHRASLTKRWDEAMSRGIEAVARWSGPTDPETWESKEYVQAGIYDHEWRRFLPMAPPVRVTDGFNWDGMLHAYFDRPFKRVISVVAIGANADDAHIGRLDVSVHQAGSGEELLRYRVPKRYIPEFELAAFGETLVYRDRVMLKMTRWHHIFGPKRQITKEAVPRFHFWGEQYMLYLYKSAPEGVAVKGGSVVTKSGAFSVHPTSTHYHCKNVVRDKTFRFLAVSALDYSPVSMEGFHICYSGVDLIDLQTKTVRHLGHVRAVTAAEFGEDGALYVQLGDELRRYATPDSSDFETIMANVALVPQQADNGMDSKSMEDGFGHSCDAHL